MLKTQLYEMSRKLRISVFKETTHSIKKDGQQEIDKGWSKDDE